MSNDSGPQRQQGLVLIEEERLKERFTQIPNTILRRPDVTPGAKLTYVVLLSYAWQEDSCFPGQDSLAHDTGVSRRSVITYLQELQTKGLLAVQRRGLGQTNIYTLTRWDTPRDTPRSADFSHQEVQNLSLPEVQNLHTKNTQGKKTQNSNTQNSNRFEDEILHQCDESKPFSKKRNFAKFRDFATTAELPLRGKRAAPAAIGQVLSQRHGDRLLEGPSTAAEGPSEVTNPSRGTESQVGGGKAPLRASRGRGRSPRATEQIEALVEQFSNEFHDDEHVKPNISHAARLWNQSGLSEDAFCSRMYEARSRTKQAPGIEKRAAGEAGKWGARNKMPYFFACLEDVLGMRDDQAGRSSTTSS